MNLGNFARGTYNVLAGMGRAARTALTPVGQTARLTKNAFLQAYHVTTEFGMGGKPLFHDIEDKTLAKALRTNSRALTEGRIPGGPVGKHGPEIPELMVTTFNQSLRNKIFAGAAIIGAVGMAKESFNYQDPRISVQDSSGRSKYDMGGTGDMVLGMYRNGR